MYGIPWLLEPENPSVRYRTLRDILDFSADDPQVVKAQAAIPSSKDVLAIMDRQDPEGWWETEERATGIKRASGQLLILSEFGMPPDERTDKACEFVLGKPWLPMRHPICIVPCYTVNCLRFLSHFGFGEDPRVEQGWKTMVEWLDREEGLLCWYQKQRPCHWLAVKGLWAFAAAPDESAARTVIARLAECLLSYSFDFEGEESLWLRFGFPWYFQSDLLDALEALAACGYGADPRYRELVMRVMAKRQKDKRWLLEGGCATARVERLGQPSKWITLKALRVLVSLRIQVPGYLTDLILR